MNFHKKFGELIRLQREKKNVRQIDLAERLGYTTPQFISLVERGMSKVPPAQIKLICGMLGIPLEATIKQLVNQYEFELRKEIFGE